MNNYPIYGVDTVALLAYYTENLGPVGKEVFLKAEKNEAYLLVPEIVIGEMIYTVLNERDIFGEKVAKDKLLVILTILYQSPSFQVKPLSFKGWNIVLQSKISELHDRMIVATCIQENVSSLITLDSDIKQSNEVPVIW